MTAEPDRTVIPLVPSRRPQEPAPVPAPPEPLWREVAGEVLRERRLASGRTLRQVADRAGVSPQYLSEVERGLKEPSSEMLASIAGALGWRLADLLAAAAFAVESTRPTAQSERLTVLRLAGAGAFGMPSARPSGPVLLAS